MVNPKPTEIVYKLSDNYVLFHGQLDEDRHYLFDIQSGKVFRLNAVSYAMLESFDGEKTVEGVVAELTKQFDASENEIRNDLLEMVQVWLDRGILILKGDL